MEDVSDDAKNDQFPGKYLKIWSLFQVMYYDLRNGYIKKHHFT